MLTVKAARILLFPSICLLVSACNQELDKPMKFSADLTYDVNTLPEFISIELENHGDVFVCIETSELNGRGGNIVVDNYNVTNVGYPTYILEKDGVYLADGITVVGPKSARSVLVDLSRLTDNTKSINHIALKLPYFKCDDLFRKNFKPHAYIHKSEWRKTT